MTTLRTTRFRTLAPIAGAALAVASASAVAVAPSASAAPAPTSCTTTGRLTVCDYTSPAEYQLFIPEGVSRVAVLAIGGAGGKSLSAAGGFGQQVVDYLEVSEGDFLFANVGGVATNNSCADTRVECSAGYGEGGFSSSGGGGGGASDVRTISASQPGSRDSRLIVAGGGGGAGGTGGAQAGGAGGAAGVAGTAGAGAPNGGGLPGTQTAAGKGGLPNGTDGFLDKGGSSLGNGGAGGGGYFGGGSGTWTGSSPNLPGPGGGGGGGGGSSLVAHPTASVTSATQGAGRVQLRYSVDDRTAPHIELNVESTLVPATSSAGAIVTYTATATDDVDGTDPVSCTPASGTTFKIGSTTISCEAFDVSGNRGTASATVQVVDVAPPTLNLPALIDVPATNRTGAVVTYTATANDVVDGPITPDCRPPSGSLFAVGTTNVVCTARDTAGNLITGSFTVTVSDRTPPMLSVPDNLTVEATGAGGASVLYAVSAADDISQPVTVDCSPPSGSTFAPGLTTVTCTATDAAGNTTTKSFSVTVVDTAGPALSLPADNTFAATSASGATVTYTATATDVVDGARPVTCSKPSGSVFPVGTTTVTCTSTDTRGNTSTGTFTVTVEPYQANLEIAVTGGFSVVRGASATYTVTVTNKGPSTATNVRTVLAVSGLSITSTNPITTSGSVKVQGVTYTGALWTTASIPVNGSVTFTLTGTVTAKKGDTVVAQGATTSDVPDPVTTNNVATVRSTVPR
jgi:hypothetical protein